jgi:predicted SprT family Zn-dependent metalloprotease
MDWSQAVTLARTLMNEHGLSHVPFVATKGLRTFGVCNYRARTRFGVILESSVVSIGLSHPLTLINDESVVRNTILHEIAHAKAGPEAGHGYMWKSVAASVGADPQAHCGEDTKTVPGPYQATCPCGLDHNMYRMPQRRKICRRCKASLDFKRVL